MRCSVEALTFTTRTKKATSLGGGFFCCLPSFPVVRRAQAKVRSNLFSGKAPGLDWRGLFEGMPLLINRMLSRVSTTTQERWT